MTKIKLFNPNTKVLGLYVDALRVLVTNPREELKLFILDLCDQNGNVSISLISSILKIPQRLAEDLLNELHHDNLVEMMHKEGNNIEESKKEILKYELSSSARIHINKRSLKKEIEQPVLFWILSKPRIILQYSINPRPFYPDFKYYKESFDDIENYRIDHLISKELRPYVKLSEEIIGVSEEATETIVFKYDLPLILTIDNPESYKLEYIYRKKHYIIDSLHPDIEGLIKELKMRNFFNFPEIQIQETAQKEITQYFKNWKIKEFNPNTNTIQIVLHSEQENNLSKDHNKIADEVDKLDQMKISKNHRLIVEVSSNWVSEIEVKFIPKDKNSINLLFYWFILRNPQLLLESSISIESNLNHIIKNFKKTYRVVDFNHPPFKELFNVLWRFGKKNPQIYEIASRFQEKEVFGLGKN